MPAQVFRGGVHHHVRAEFDGAHQVWGGYRVIDDQRHTCLVRNLGDGLNIEHIVAGVGDGFAEEELGVGAHRLTPLLQIVRVLNKRGFNAEVGKRVFEEVIGATVDGGGGNNVVARPSDVQNCVGDGRLSRSHQQRPHSPFKGCDAVFDHLLGGVVQAGVNRPELGESKTVSGLFRVLKNERGGLVDG